MVGKNSSEGTKVSQVGTNTGSTALANLTREKNIFKVTLGENAPVVQEGAGIVTRDSLANESVQAGGEFAENRNIRLDEAGSHGNNSKTSSSSSHHHHAGAGSAGGQPISSAEQGHAAPTYVNNQFIRDSAGPHGKNVTEDPDMTGRPGKFNVEVGSKEDPSREAERNMLLKQTRGAAGTGERQVGERGTDEQPYKVLGSETSA